MPLADLLVVYPSPLEDPGGAIEAHAIGVGKVAAVAGLYSLLEAVERRRRVRGVLLCGVAGAFPERHRDSPPPVGLFDVCVVGSDRLGDEGVDTEQGFVDFGQRPPGGGVSLVDCGPFPAQPQLVEKCAQALAAPVVRGVTVSACSGTEVRSRAVHHRCHADVETMEGAAVAYACRRFELPFVQVRVISNWTGDRERAGWDLGRATAVLEHAMRRLADAL
jgi:futalosine hydrolase